MERCVLVFREQLTADQEGVLVRDIMAVDLKQEVAAPFSSLSDIIGLVCDDIDPTSLAIYSLSAPNKMSLLEMRDWRPIYRLKLSDVLIRFIERYSLLINKLSDLSSGMSELDMHLRSYAHHLNEAVGSDARSFADLSEILQTDLISSERDRLVGVIRAELEQFRLE